MNEPVGSSTLRIERATAIPRSPRVQQVEGIFDVPPNERAEIAWDHDLPLDEHPWQIGLIVGPSGSGKSTLLADRWGVPEPFTWTDAAVVDDFPETMSVRDITKALSAVGFSSPPSWLRPFATLSNGEQFRATLARSLVELADPVVIDEFTSVVDRTVARVGSAAVSKYLRRSDRQLVAATCHYDVEDWLQPDWVYDVGAVKFAWRHLQPRPPIELEVYRTPRTTWRLFARHHYLSASIAPGAECHVALVDGEPAAFFSSIPFPHPRVRHARRGNRLVTLPDFQGVGIGNTLETLIASVWTARGYRFYVTSGVPGQMSYWAASPNWRVTRKPSTIPPSGHSSSLQGGKAAWGHATFRITMSVEYVGPPATDEQVAALTS